MKFEMSFTRTNKSDPMEMDIFTLEVEAEHAPERFADFDQGTASVSFGYPGVSQEYSVVRQTDQDDVISLDQAGKSVFRIWQRDNDDLKVDHPVVVSEGEFDRSQARITRIARKTR
ncbi:hypothetical protein [Pseudomonas sp.]|uniref:hypothetical protein n=1 Tax=Pseudomonas sp. TaxID=306 RepID=UPI00289B9342|nr:hypothetical protein [Pseudomonas sp.]